MTELIRRAGRGTPETPVRPSASPIGPPTDTECYPFLLPPVEADEVGRLGSYRVLRLVGRGGMGLVFHAEDITLRRPVALKVMRPDLAAGSAGWKRFLREARLMASIKHDCLVTVFQAGQENGAVFLAMELLDGCSLQEWRERTPAPPLSEVLRIALEIATGLTAIHGRGLIHRDLKPANLWLEANGRVKILDFGLARLVEDEANLTGSGAILGTPLYMSPEQARGEPLDPRSDLFSFGGVLYALCSGAPPFESATAAAILVGIVNDDPTPVRRINRAVPKALSDLIDELLAKDPENRPPSAEAVLKRLQDIEAPAGGQASGWRTVPTNWAGGRRSSKAGPKRRSLARRVGVGVAVTLLIIVALGAGWAVLGSRKFRDAATKGDSGARAGTYLSDLAPVRPEHWPFIPPARPGEAPRRPVGEMRVRGKAFPHGILMHPPPGHEGSASVCFRLAKSYRVFRVEVSMHDGPGRAGSEMTFSVYGDGRLLWKSRPVMRQEDAQVCEVTVTGVDELRIQVGCEGDARGAHGVWLEPWLTR